MPTNLPHPMPGLTGCDYKVLARLIAGLAMRNAKEALVASEFAKADAALRDGIRTLSDVAAWSSENRTHAKQVTDSLISRPAGRSMAGVSAGMARSAKKAKIQAWAKGRAKVPSELNNRTPAADVAAGYSSRLRMYRERNKKSKHR